MNELMAILSPILGEELARDIIQHRRGLKCPLTPRGARSLLKQYELTGNAVEAAEEHLNRGWQGFRAEWMTKPARYQDQRNPTLRTSANYGNAELSRAPEPMTAEEREKRARLAAQARELMKNAADGIVVYAPKEA